MSVCPLDYKIDVCILFGIMLLVTNSELENWGISVQPGGVSGNVVCCSMPNPLQAQTPSNLNVMACHILKRTQVCHLSVREFNLVACRHLYWKTFQICIWIQAGESPPGQQALWPINSGFSLYEPQDRWHNLESGLKTHTKLKQQQLVVGKHFRDMRETVRIF